MALIGSAKSRLLLEAPLEALHQESLEWLEEIEFWKDETAFFYALIMGKTRARFPLAGAREIRSLEDHLVYVSAETLDDLRQLVQAHERFLAKLMDDVSLSEQAYRTKHRAIAKKMAAFEEEFRAMKRKVFLLARQPYPKLKIVNIKHKK